MGFILLSKTSSTLKLVSTSWLGWHDVQGEGNLWGASHAALRWVFNTRGTCLHVRISISSPLTSWSQVSSLVLMPNSRIECDGPNWVQWIPFPTATTFLQTSLLLPLVIEVGYRKATGQAHLRTTTRGTPACSVAKGFFGVGGQRGLLGVLFAALSQQKMYWGASPRSLKIFHLF